MFYPSINSIFTMPNYTIALKSLQREQAVTACTLKFMLAYILLKGSLLQFNIRLEHAQAKRIERLPRLVSSPALALSRPLNIVVGVTWRATRHSATVHQKKASPESSPTPYPSRAMENAHSTPLLSTTLYDLLASDYISKIAVDHTVISAQ